MANSNTHEEIVDGVKRFPRNGIKMIVVGAGVGGLGAALECWRKGCDVVVLERSERLSPMGDYFTITPPGVTTLKEYPSMYADYHECVYDCTVHVYTPSGRAVTTQKPEWKQPGAEHSAPDVDISFLKRRPVYNKMQLDQLGRLGVPVHWGQKVSSVEEEADTVIVKTASGSIFTGDVCVAANGLGSTIPGFSTEGDVHVQDSGYAVARVAFPCNAIKEGSLAATLLAGVEEQPQFRAYLANDLHLILFLTKDWVAWVFTHQNDGMAAESWGNLRDVEDLFPYLEKAGESWDPAVIDFIKQTPEKVVDWNLRWRDGTYQWTSDGGRLVRLGDAAHAFLPTAGNGAVQALEDGNSLGECMQIGGKENVQWATKVHNKLRFERVSILQQTGFLNREELHTADIAAIEEKPEQASVGFFKHGRWIWDHDAEKYARKNYAACLASLQEGRPFTNTNIPPGHVYQPWSLESEKKRMMAGIRSNLKQNGYWGVEETPAEYRATKPQEKWNEIRMSENQVSMATA